MNSKLIAIAAAIAVLAGGALSAAPASAASTNGSVLGHVRTIGGVPISGATVSVTRVGATTPLKKTTTSKTGRYEMALKPGTYTLSASDPKNRYATSLTPTTFTVETGDRDHVNKKLSPGSAITGKVTTTSGRLLRGVAVTATGTDINGHSLPDERATTNSKGEYKLRGLTAGVYRLRYAATGYAATYWNRSGGQAAVEGEGSLLGVDIGAKRTGTSVTMVKAAKITGRVYVNGIPAKSEYGAITATLIRADDAKALWTATVGDYDNTFKFGELPEGDYIVRFAGADGVAVATKDLNITLGEGQARTGLVETLATTGPTTALISASINPEPVVPGTGPFELDVTTYGYANAAGAAVTLSWDGAVQQTGTLDVSNSATFSVPSEFWAGKRGSAAPAVTIDVAATSGTKAATATAIPVIR